MRRLLKCKALRSRCSFQMLIEQEDTSDEAYIERHVKLEADERKLHMPILLRRIRKNTTQGRESEPLGQCDTEKRTKLLSPRRCNGGKGKLLKTEHEKHQMSPVHSSVEPSLFGAQVPRIAA
jgi:hypothetical protein